VIVNQMLIRLNVKRSVSHPRVKHLMSKAPIALLAFILLSSLSCGKRRPPLPPTERVSQRVELSGFQRGSNVVLSWRMPARNAGKGSVINISRADIYRLAEPANAPLTLSEEEFASRSVLIATVPITDADFGLKTITYRDQLQFAGQSARLRYSVRLANASGQKAAFSNFAVIEPIARVAAAPTSLSAELSQDAVTLTWTGPGSNIDTTTPVNLLGYYIYRSTSEKEPAKLLNQSPITATVFRDEFFEFGKSYYYFVRSVSSGAEAAPIESDESNIVTIKPVDTFPPSPPSAITLAAGQNVISIFFAVNPEKDVAGYKIYRSTDPDLPKEKWELLTLELLKTNTFQDTGVVAGKTYFYYLTATDTVGNVSQPSEVVSEMAPQEE
jgi:fibronectin type 3 domain-containing protein